MKKIFKIIIWPFKTTAIGFYNVCLILSRGFYFYFYLLFSLISMIIPLGFFKKIKEFFKKMEDRPASFLLLIVLYIGFIIFTKYIYVNDVVVHVDDSDKEYVVTNDYVNEEKDEDKLKQLNLFQYFGAYSVDNINFNNLKRINKNTVSWIVVDNTNINYPVVQYSDNDYYLSHDFYNNYSIGGWVFMDYRNSSLLDDYNTIFYGHNLLNKTSFGSLVTLFNDKWYNKSNHRIVVYTDQKKYTYEIFSIYTIEPEVYYLDISHNDNYQEFLNILKGRSVYNFDVTLDNDDKIITLSTCTDDNKNRRVVHARLLSVS